MDAAIIARKSVHLVTEYTLNAGAGMEAISAFIRAARATGEVRFVTAQGGTRSVVFTERLPADEAQAGELLRILNV